MNKNKLIPRAFLGIKSRKRHKEENQRKQARAAQDEIMQQKLANGLDANIAVTSALDNVQAPKKQYKQVIEVGPMQQGLVTDANGRILNVQGTAAEQAAIANDYLGGNRASVQQVMVPTTQRVFTIPGGQHFNTREEYQAKLQQLSPEQLIGMRAQLMADKENYYRAASVKEGEKSFKRANKYHEIAKANADKFGNLMAGIISAPLVAPFVRGAANFISDNWIPLKFNHQRGYVLTPRDWSPQQISGQKGGYKTNYDVTLSDPEPLPKGYTHNQTIVGNNGSEFPMLENTNGATRNLMTGQYEAMPYGRYALMNSEYKVGDLNQYFVPAYGQSEYTTEPVVMPGLTHRVDFTETQGESFNDAFARARKEGKSVFTWNGKQYGTDLSTDPNYKAPGWASQPTTTTTGELRPMSAMAK